MSGRLLRKGIWPKLPLLLFLVAAVAGLAVLGQRPAQAQTPIPCTQAALRAAVDSGGDYVLPAGCVITLTGAASEDSNAGGDLDVPTGKTVTIEGAGPGVVIDGGGNDRVFDIQPGGSLTLVNLTVRNGAAPSGEAGGAIRVQSSAVGNDTLTLQDVVVEGSVTLNGNGGGIALEVVGGGTVALTIKGSVTVRNNAAFLTGGALGGGIYISGASLTVDAGASLVVENNSASGGAATAGGGIYADGDVTVSGGASLTVRGNSSAAIGGGIAILSGRTLSASSGTAASTVTVENNNATGDGGGIQNAGTISLTGTSTAATTLKVSGNSAGGNGGGMRLVSGAVTQTGLTAIVVSNNQATGSGGGIHNAAGTLTLTGATVSGNSAGTTGGGIHAGSAVNLTASTVSGNTAGTTGGGIHAGSAVNLTASTVSGNTAGTSGGGIYVAGGSASLTNVTISGNKATLQDGGGILFASGTNTVTFATIANNTADDFGGGVRVATGATASIDGSILAGNSAASGPDCSSAGTISSFTYNVVQQTLPSAGCSAGTGTVGGTDPQLKPLASNGGPVQTHAIPSTSPAIDRVPTTAAPCTTVTSDARGATRPQDGNLDATNGCDAGAFESTPLDISVSKSDAPDPVNTGGNVTYTITVTGGGPDTIASGVVVTDTLPSGVSFVSATVSPTGAGTCSPVGDTVTCNLAAITGASPAPAVTITIVANVTALGGTRTNTVTVAMNEADPAPGNNTASASTTVLPNQPPAPPSMVAIWPASSSLAMITFQAPQGATSYKLESALNFEFTFGVNSTTINASDLAFGNTIFVGLPTADGLTFYYRLSACNSFGCSSTVFAGALAARQFPGGTTEHWNFVMGAFEFAGTVFAWGQNQVSVPGKNSDFNFYDGVQGFGGVLKASCTNVAPGSSCTRSWAAGNPFVSVSQEFPPFGEVGVAVRTH
jgi:uncharacterized repeat protein (TIGR01451 family)